MIYRIKWLYCFLWCLLLVKTNAQRSVEKQSVVFYGYQNSVDVGKNWLINTEFQERHFVFPFDQNSFMFNTQVHKLSKNKHHDFSVALFFFDQTSPDPHQEIHSRTLELRPHLEYAFNHKLSNIKWDHRFRIEGRFLHIDATYQEGDPYYQYSTCRARYRLQGQIHLRKLDENRNLKLKVGDEVSLNMASRNNLALFSQNRAYLALSWDLTKYTSFDWGYTNFYIKRNETKYFLRNVLTFTLSQKFKL